MTSSQEYTQQIDSLTQKRQVISGQCASLIPVLFNESVFAAQKWMERNVLDMIDLRPDLIEALGERVKDFKDEFVSLKSKVAEIASSEEKNTRESIEQQLAVVPQDRFVSEKSLARIWERLVEKLATSLAPLVDKYGFLKLNPPAISSWNQNSRGEYNYTSHFHSHEISQSQNLKQYYTLVRETQSVNFELENAKRNKKGALAREAFTNA